MNSTSQTLAERIANGRIAIPEGLQLAMLMAEQLRILHDSGTAHGGLTTAAVSISGSSLELLPSEATAATAYDAPEVRAGGEPDIRSDIFSFGAIVFEMLTGQKAFEGQITAGPLECGSAPIDRLVNGCIAASPDSRYQRIQKMMLELRLLQGDARRGKVPVPSAVIARPERQQAVPPPAAMRAAAPARQPDTSAMQAIQDLEGRISQRLHDQEKTIANVAHVANEVLKALREQQATVAAVPAPRHEPAPPPPPRYEQTMERQEPMPTRGMGFRGYDELQSGGSRADKMMDLVSDKLSRLDMVVSAAVERLGKLEHILDQFDIDAAALRDSVTRDIRNFERALKTQGAAIESARTAMGQTDDLVERVVEAIDSLQSMFVTTAEERTLAS
jgi:eukaryotic-like serine/threonine-protein kinase